MIYSMVQDLWGLLRDRGYPVSVQYGPDRVSTEGYHFSSIIFELDRNAGDQIDPPAGSATNPRYRWIRKVGVVATIRTAVAIDGAMCHDHEDENQKLVDALVCAIGYWCSANKSRAPEFYEARPMFAEEIGVEGDSNGAGYVLKFRVARGIYERDYDGSALPTGSPTKASNTSRVTADGTNYEEVS